VNHRELAILQSVVYASLFDYPLTLDQLHESLIESDLSPSEILATFQSSDALQRVVEYVDGYFVPAGRADLIAERRRRETRSRAFLRAHRVLLGALCAVPFTRMVALSGSVAHMNLEDGGDLDLFIVTRGPRVWTVTVAVLLLAKLAGQRRVVCANFVLSDSHLSLDQHDLFTANQVIHLKPLTGGDVLDDFLAANPFVRRLYPNALRRPARPIAAAAPPRAVDWIRNVLELALTLPSPLVESTCRRLYGWHLRRKARSWQSPEQVRLQSDYLKLHTRSHRDTVLERFEVEVDKAVRLAERASRRALGAAR